jgi:hypothetical protein
MIQRNNIMRFSKEEIEFLCDMFETSDVEFAVEKFATMLTEERVSTDYVLEFLRKIMVRYKNRK